MKQLSVMKKLLISYLVLVSGSVVLMGLFLLPLQLHSLRRNPEELLLQFAAICLFILAAGAASARFLTQNIRKSLLGFEPGIFARRYLLREEILDSLKEGILAADKDGRILYQNAPAGRFFQGGCLPEDFPLWKEIRQCLDQGTPQSGLMAELKQSTLLVHLIPVMKLDAADGVLILLWDRTEAVHMAEQLTGTRHVIEAMRANTHEFLNKLHVVSGLLQINETKEAIAYISDVSSDIEQGYQTVIRQIRNKTIAALILGKQSRARELNIRFILRKDSCLDEHTSCLSTRELVTIIGNLLENAFEAVKDVRGLRQTELFISSSDSGLTIIADDTGHGMTPGQISRIYSGQYTTKGEGHGIGLTLIQEIIHRHNGYLEIESVPGEGSSFAVSIGKFTAQEEAP
ncbi:MAG: ATP-binding protein [Eubacteriales bacterium]|nr:ATP-binding protein [Eubacteriales bacterium]